VVLGPAISAPYFVAVNKAVVQEGVLFVVAVNFGKLDLITREGSSPSEIVQLSEICRINC
jgi:hypothetical protein